MGLTGFRAALDGLPDDPVATVEAVLEKLHLFDEAAESYLHRALSTVGGWAAYARYLAWNRELHGEADDSLVHLLAIRLAWDGALFALHGGPAFRAAWNAATATTELDADLARAEVDLAIDAVLQDACEQSFQRADGKALRGRTPGRDGYAQAGASRLLHRRALGNLPARLGGRCARGRDHRLRRCSN